MNDDQQITEAIRVLYDAGVRTAADFDRLMEAYNKEYPEASSSDNGLEVQPEPLPSITQKEAGE